MNRQRKYARLLIEVGLNLQKGQELIISAPIESAEFVRMCADAAYDVGCREVTVRWSDDYLVRQKYLRAPAEIFSEYPEWVSVWLNSAAEKGTAYLAVSAGDPELLKGVDSERISAAQRVGGEALKTFRQLQTSNFFPWCVASVPVKTWAKKVFPELSEQQAMEKLADAIYETVRIYDDDSDPVQLWHEHLTALEQRRAVLNSYGFKYLKYRNSLGTDVTVELPQDYVFEGGGDRAAAGYTFIANMPTEETFTVPLRTGVNERVVASMPLVLNGNVVDGFWFEFKDGRVEDFGAREGLDVLAATLSVDEGARYLGEAALVPNDSPISNSKILFYNTLFDENASCHFALGNGYPCIKGGQEMTPEQLKEHGVNASLIHVDFMVGTPDMSITGITADGSEIPVFVDGNFAF